MILREKMWVKVWVNRPTHTLTHYGTGRKSTGQDVPGAFGVYSHHIICSIKFPIVSAALSCIWRVAWV